MTATRISSPTPDFDRAMMSSTVTARATAGTQTRSAVTTQARRVRSVVMGYRRIDYRLLPIEFLRFLRPPHLPLRVPDLDPPRGLGLRDDVGDAAGWFLGARATEEG